IQAKMIFTRPRSRKAIILRSTTNFDAQNSWTNYFQPSAECSTLTESALKTPQHLQKNWKGSTPSKHCRHHNYNFGVMFAGGPNVDHHPYCCVNPSTYSLIITSLGFNGIARPNVSNYFFEKHTFNAENF